MRNLLISGVLIAAWLTPRVAAAEDCWTATLQVAVEESYGTEGRKKGEVYRRWDRLQGEGEVRFLVGGGKKGIVHQSLRGGWEGTIFRETSCVVHEGKISGRLTEGVTRKDAIHTAFWSMRLEGHSAAKAAKGCRQETFPDIAEEEERADPRFHDIVHPGLDRLVSLCKKARSLPALGDCRTTPDEISGHLTLTQSSPGVGEPTVLSLGGLDVRYQTRYRWAARRVPCGCTAAVVRVVGEARLNGRPLREGVEFSLSGATIETIGRGQVVIETPDHLQIRVKSRTRMDLSGLCREIEAGRDESPRWIRDISGAFYLIAKKLAGADGKGPWGIQATAGAPRGGLVPERPLIAAVGFRPGTTPAPLFLAGRGAGEERTDSDEAAARQAPAAVFCHYRPEEGILLLEVLRGALMVRESAGGTRLLREGEAFQRRWPPDLDPAKLQTVEAWFAPQ